MAHAHTSLRRTKSTSLDMIRAMRTAALNLAKGFFIRPKEILKNIFVKHQKYFSKILNIKTSVNLQLLPVTGGEAGHELVGLLLLVRVHYGEDGHCAVPASCDDGPGGGGDGGRLAGQGVVGDHGGVVSPEQSDGAPSTVVVPHILLSLGETFPNKDKMSYSCERLVFHYDII